MTVLTSVLEKLMGLNQGPALLFLHHCHGGWFLGVCVNWRHGCRHVEANRYAFAMFNIANGFTADSSSYKIEVNRAMNPIRRQKKHICLMSACQG